MSISNKLSGSIFVGLLFTTYSLIAPGPLTSIAIASSVKAPGLPICRSGQQEMINVNGVLVRQCRNLTVNEAITVAKEGLKLADQIQKVRDDASGVGAPHFNICSGLFKRLADGDKSIANDAVSQCYEAAREGSRPSVSMTLAAGLVALTNEIERNPAIIPDQNDPKARMNYFLQGRGPLTEAQLNQLFNVALNGKGPFIKHDNDLAISFLVASSAPKGEWRKVVDVLMLDQANVESKKNYEKGVQVALAKRFWDKLGVTEARYPSKLVSKNEGVKPLGQHVKVTMLLKQEKVAACIFDGISANDRRTQEYCAYLSENFSFTPALNASGEPINSIIEQELDI